MTEQQRHHYITEHIWRFLRAAFILLGMTVWLIFDEGGITGTDWIVLACGCIAHIVEQFHGFICNLIERVLHWKQDFNSMD